MELTDVATQSRNPADFESEALPLLQNVARFARLLTRNAVDAEDLTQETFLRAFQHWNTFHPGTDCRKWLFAICRNAYLRDRKRSARFVATDDPDSESFAARELYDHAATSGLEALFDRVDLGPSIERGICELPDEYRETLLLIDVEDRSYADAAVILGVPIGTIRSRLFRARRLLQEGLIEHARDRGFEAVTQVDTLARRTEETA
jgi:RNA polymerase sigma-70 factor, ECF subfamily